MPFCSLFATVTLHTHMRIYNAVWDFGQRNVFYEQLFDIFVQNHDNRKHGYPVKITRIISDFFVLFSLLCVPVSQGFHREIDYPQ